MPAKRRIAASHPEAQWLAEANCWLPSPARHSVTIVAQLAVRSAQPPSSHPRSIMAAAQEPPATDAAAATAAAAPAAPAVASSSSSIQANTTVLSTLHNLLRAHVAAHPSPTLPYLHPYAPLPASAWKGKAKAELLSQSQQADALQAIRETMEGAKAVLAKRENDRLRLTRAMKEVWVFMAVQCSG